MKKTLILAGIAFSLLGFASAQQATSTDQVPPALPPILTTGSSTVDNQVKTLRKEYESKIKALQQEYLTKLKVLIGERKQEKKDERASTTPKTDNGMRVGEEKKRPIGTTSASGTPMLPPKNRLEGDRGQMMGPRVEGTSTEEVSGQGVMFRILRGFLGF